jgi:hypothetical protein
MAKQETPHTKQVLEIRHYIEALWKAFQDGKLAFGEQVFAEDAAATELVFTGTHTGPLMTPNAPDSTNRKPCDPPFGIGPENQGWLDCLGTCVF